MFDSSSTKLKYNINERLFNVFGARIWHLPFSRSFVDSVLIKTSRISKFTSHPVNNENSVYSRSIKAKAMKAKYELHYFLCRSVCGPIRVVNQR